MSVISAVFVSSTDIGASSRQRGAQIGESLFSILIYSFGILVAHRYHVMGLRVVRSIRGCFVARAVRIGWIDLSTRPTR